jgi:hypothetical protein
VRSVYAVLTALIFSIYVGDIGYRNAPIQAITSIETNFANETNPNYRFQLVVFPGRSGNLAPRLYKVSGIKTEHGCHSQDVLNALLPSQPGRRSSRRISQGFLKFKSPVFNTGLLIVLPPTEILCPYISDCMNSPDPALRSHTTRFSLAFGLLATAGLLSKSALW